MNGSIELSDGEQWLKIVQQKIASLQFGVVQIVVHDSQVVQIERTEKVRLQRSDRADERN
jgi:hypothetical protein